MRQSIVTKYMGKTDFRPSRVSAKCDAGSITVSYDHELSADGNHAAAARALLSKLGWDAPKHLEGAGWFGGDLGKGRRVWVHAVTDALLSL